MIVEDPSQRDPLIPVLPSLMIEPLGALVLEAATFVHSKRLIDRSGSIYGSL